jgi:hypothetical protein
MKAWPQDRSLLRVDGFEAYAALLLEILLLQRAIKLKWVSGMVAHPMSHSDEHERHDGDFEGPAHGTLSAVIPPPGSASARAAIFNRLMNPALPPNQASDESDMPMIH